MNLRKNKSLILQFAIINIKLRFKSTHLGLLWAAIEPLLTFIVLYVVFSSIRAREESFPIYLITGIMFYHIFVRGTSGGLNSLLNNQGIIKSINIEREFFPVVTTVAIGILTLVTVGVFFGLMPVFQFIPDWTIILLPIPLLLILFLVLGLSYLLSIATVYARDVQHIWIIITFTLIFLSPIFWYIDQVEGILLDIQKINPLGQIIEIAHKLVIDGQIPPLNDWLYTTLFVLSIFFVGYFVFHKYEEKVAEVL